MEIVCDGVRSDAATLEFVVKRPPGVVLTVIRQPSASVLEGDALDVQPQVLVQVSGRC